MEQNLSGCSQMGVCIAVLTLLMNPVIGVTDQVLSTSLDITNTNTSFSNPIEQFTPSYTLHDPIVITSNEDFPELSTQGVGVEQDPYVIQGLEVVTTGICISIRNTDAAFIIRNCLIKGGTTGSFDDHGIELINVKHGVMQDNIIEQKAVGINLHSSSYNLVDQNNISENTLYGIRLEDGSNNNVLSNNGISDNSHGIQLDASSFNLLVHNTISSNMVSAVNLNTAPDNTLTSNIMLNDGVTIGGYGSDVWRQNITPDNIVNGKLLAYFWNSTDRIIRGRLYGQVILANCTGFIVKNGKFNDATIGIRLAFSKFCTITNNIISRNSYHGVNLLQSFNCTIINNTIIENGRNGIDLFISSNNTIANNTISRNSEVGLACFTFSDNNLIFLNKFGNNRQRNAYDYGTDNQWNSTDRGNYWSDYAGTGLYQLSGSARSIDYHPFVYVDEGAINTPNPLIVGAGGIGLLAVATVAAFFAVKYKRKGQEREGPIILLLY